MTIIARRLAWRRLLLATALMPGVARAQDAGSAPASTPTAADQQDASPGDVVVTATRRSTRLQQTPVAVSVFDSRLIAQQNVVTARDLAGQTPGVTIQRSGITPLTQTFFVRGIGNSDPIFDPNIAQYVDDVYLPRAINGLTDLTDIERVEILRGPQGTLFGENADAGAIRYVTKTPTAETHTSFDVASGTYSALDAHGYITGAILPGLVGSFAVAHDQHDGYTYDPTIRRDVNNQQTTGARAKLLATLGSALTLLLTLLLHSQTADRRRHAAQSRLRPVRSAPQLRIAAAAQP